MYLCFKKYKVKVIHTCKREFDWACVGYESACGHVITQWRASDGYRVT